MTPPIFDGSDIQARVLLDRLKKINRDVRAGKTSDDVRDVYSQGGITPHDYFTWSVRRLDTKKATLADLALQGESLKKKMDAAQDAAGQRMTIAAFVGIGGLVAGVVAAGLTFFGGPGAQLFGQWMGLAATASMLGSAATIGFDSQADERRRFVVNDFDSTLKRWGAHLSREDEMQRAEKKRGFPTHMLSVDEKRALAAELEESLES